jgi:hypothetical protein
MAEGRSSTDEPLYRLYFVPGVSILITPEWIDMLRKNRWYLRHSIAGNFATGIVSAITMIIISVLLLSCFFGADIESESNNSAEALFFSVGVLICIFFLSISVQFHHVLLAICSNQGQSSEPSTGSSPLQE